MLKKRFLMKVLAATVAATIAVTPATAFAEGGEKVEAVNENKEEEFGDITADGEDEAALEIEANHGNVEVKTGSLTSEQGPGLKVVSDHDSSSIAYVKGDINSDVSGVVALAKYDSGNLIVVEGDIKSDWYGVGALAGEYNDEEDERLTDPDESINVVAVNGSIDSEESGISACAWNGASNAVGVTGNVTGHGSEGAVVAIAYGADRNNILIVGDVKGDDIGVNMFSQVNEDENVPVNNVVVEGTVSAKEAAIVDNRVKGGRNTVTVWKIETDGFTAAKATLNHETGKYDVVEDEEAAKNIQYIIRVNQTDGATLKATDADGNALATVTGLNGELEYALEGDKVLLKIDIEDGYSLDAAYGDEGQTLELTKDAAGNYYLVVPRNGGVSFSVKLSKNKKDDDKDDDKKNDNNQTAGSYVLSDSAAVSLISSASSGSSVTLSGLSGTGLSASVVSQLLARRDIDVTVTFMLNGVLYKIVIPAGADIAGLVGADGSVSFEALGQAFGIAPV